MPNKKNERRWAYILPNTFTALNLACGFGSILLTMNNQLYYACLVIGVGTLFDSVDGRIARMTGTQSAFGEQFDSMSDLITFGTAPAILVYQQFLVHYGRLGMMVSFAFTLCAALRLARFNVNIERIHTDYFQGLPVPGSALALIGFYLFSRELGHPDFLKPLSLVYFFFYSILMISNVPFPAFKKSEWVKGQKKYVLMGILGVLASLFVYGEIVIGILISVYVIGSIIYFLTHRGRFQDIFNWEEDAEDKEEGTTI